MAVVDAWTAPLDWDFDRLVSEGDMDTYISSNLLYLYNRLPVSLLTTRGDLLTRDATGLVRLGIGASGRYLRSNGADPAWSTLLVSDLTYSGLTAGQYLRASGASAAAFAALQFSDLTYSGLTSGQVLRASGASAASFTSLQAGDLPTATTAAQGAVRVGNDLAISGTILNYNKGTSFPGSPASGDLFWRTDFTPYRLYYYTGSAWQLLVGSVGVTAYNSTNLAVANATATALTLDSERDDTDAMHSTSSNTSRLTCTIAGTYLIAGAMRYAPQSGGIRYAQIRLNGTTFIASNSLMASSADNHDLTVVRRYRLAVSDYVELVAYQNSGVSVNVGAAGNFSPEFGMQWIGG